MCLRALPSAMRFTELHQRVHAVSEGSDGLIYVLTDDRGAEKNAGALL